MIEGVSEVDIDTVIYLEDVQADVDELMKRAYDSVLVSQLKRYLVSASVAHLQGKLYNLPGGAISHKYVIIQLIASLYFVLVYYKGTERPRTQQILEGERVMARLWVGYEQD